MKKMVSGNVSSEVVRGVEPLVGNVLGGLNRAWKAMGDLDVSLSDGTPSTHPAVDAFLGSWGIRMPDDFVGMTYGPAAGWPNLLQVLKAKVPVLQGKNLLLNGGGRVADSIRMRAFGVARTPVVVHRFASLADFNACSSDTVNQWLSNGENVQIMLNEHLPQFEKSDHAPMQLAVEIVGKPDVFKQMEIQQGYIGPILEPVAQTFVRLSMANEKVSTVYYPIPALAELERQFLDYFNGQTMAHRHLEGGFGLDDGAVVSGGCSGALYSLLLASPSPEVIVGAPFFAPQSGIAESANKTVYVGDGWPGLVEFMNQKPGADVLLTFPNNPDGHIPTPQVLRELVGVANANGQRLIVDMTYFNCVSPEAEDRFKELVPLLKSEAERFLIVASASKALALTKYRVALVTGDPVNVALARAACDPIDSVSAMALSEGLKDVNRNRASHTLRDNVAENRNWINRILSGIVVADGLKTLNSGLQKLHRLCTKFPEALTFVSGDGALYGALRITPGYGAPVREELGTLKLALTPGEIFSGDKSLDVDSIVKRDQSFYRISMMAKPVVYSD